jgi:hopanoid-associated phosphorylase
MILAATGLAREARLVRRPGVRPVAGGGRPQALEQALAAVANGAVGVISIGLAGALAPDLSPGDWVVADAVIAGEERLPADAAWRDALLRRLPGAAGGPLLASDAMLLGAADKARAHDVSGALAVDMESHVAARLARRLGLPFAAARVISDAADRSLPPAVSLGLRPDGQMAAGAVLGALLRDPRQLPALIRTALEAERAFRALADGGRRLGPGLAFPDLRQLALDVG